MENICNTEVRKREDNTSDANKAIELSQQALQVSMNNSKNVERLITKIDALIVSNAKIEVYQQKTDEQIHTIIGRLASLESEVKLINLERAKESTAMLWLKNNWLKLAILTGVLGSSEFISHFLNSIY